VISAVIQDMMDSVAGITIPRWASHIITVAFVASTVATALVVTDLGSVLHMIGGTAASFMIFFLPGILLMNAAIIKRTTSYGSLSQMVGPTDAPWQLEPFCNNVMTACTLLCISLHLWPLHTSAGAGRASDLLWRKILCNHSGAGAVWS